MASLWHHHGITTYPDNAIRGPCDNDVILVPLKQLQGLRIHNTSKWPNQPHPTHTYTLKPHIPHTRHKHTHTHTHTQTTHPHPHPHTHYNHPQQKLITGCLNQLFDGKLIIPTHPKYIYACTSPPYTHTHTHTHTHAHTCTHTHTHTHARTHVPQTQHSTAVWSFL